MSRSVVERKLVEINRRLKAREELLVLDHQMAALAEAADDTRLRALVSDSPQDHSDHRQAQKHADAMARSRAATAASIAGYERTLDELLEALVVDTR